MGKRRGDTTICERIKMKRFCHEIKKSSRRMRRRTTCLQSLVFYRGTDTDRCSLAPYCAMVVVPTVQSPESSDDPDLAGMPDCFPRLAPHRINWVFSLVVQFVLFVFIICVMKQQIPNNVCLLTLAPYSINWSCSPA